jgi:hypothetical protein
MVSHSPLAVHTPAPSLIPLHAGTFSDTMLVSGDSFADFPLLQVTQLSSPLPLATFAIARDRQGLPPPFGVTHSIMTKSAQLDAQSAKALAGPVLVQVPSVVVGDPLAPRKRVLDLAGIGPMSTVSSGAVLVQSGRASIAPLLLPSFHSLGFTHKPCVSVFLP